VWYLLENDSNIVFVTNHYDDDFGQTDVLGGGTFPAVFMSLISKALKRLRGNRIGSKSDDY
jgi:hypothetical protein